MRGFFKSDIQPRTCLGELEKVEQYLNKGKQLREWIGIRVYEPERQQNGEIYWHLRKNSSDKLTNIMTIGIHEGHAFLIKDVTKLAKTYVCNDCRDRFTQACHLQRHVKTCSQGTTIIDCPNKYEHVTPILRSLNWLPVRDQLYFRDAVLAFKCMSGLAPVYLSDKRDNICFVPKTISFVLSRLIRSELLKHQLRIEVKSCCRSVIDMSLSLTLKDKYIFVSSTYESTSHFFSDRGRSLT